MNIKKHNQYSPSSISYGNSRGSALIETAACVAVMALGGATAFATSDKVDEAQARLASIHQLYLTAAAELSGPTLLPPKSAKRLEAAWQNAAISASGRVSLAPTGSREPRYQRDAQRNAMRASGTR